ncbi:hypothetical protein LBWT_X1940 (plasmid) [Leptolyngbya boryana IAM M-101]|nr:hypothetical protein LBWT_X1940 [Leptolyngbya boryana IAM M-101]BAS66470.1 hypothetical protein LBDG_X1940 [Leptolyngbya boryana dg5]
MALYHRIIQVIDRKELPSRVIVWKHHLVKQYQQIPIHLAHTGPPALKPQRVRYSITFLPTS